MRFSDTEAAAFAAAHAATEAEALALYVGLRGHVNLGPMTPRLRRFLNDRLWMRQREGEPPRRLPRLFWLSLRVNRGITAVKKAIRRSLFEAGPAQAFDAHTGRSFRDWLRCGECEARRWEDVTASWLRRGHDDDDW